MLSVALFGLLASACSSNDPKPTTLPPVSATTATPTAAASVPAAAQGTTSQALDAFVRFYFDQFNVAFSTSDPSIIRRYSDPACGTCNNYIRALSKNTDHVIRGDSFAGLDVAAPAVAEGGTLVEVFFVVPRRELVDRNGVVLEKLPAKAMQHFVVNVIR